MDEAKRKQLEMQLRQLMSAATKEAEQEEAHENRYVNGRVQVIRRRKGKPDRAILESQNATK